MKRFRYLAILVSILSIALGPAADAANGISPAVQANKAETAEVAPRVTEGELTITSTRIGNLRAGVATLRDVKAKFGAPSEFKSVTAVCGPGPHRVAQWGWGLVVHFFRSDGSWIMNARFKVRSETLATESAGSVRVETYKGLAVGASRRRLLNLYPNAQRSSYEGRVSYELNGGACQCDAPSLYATLDKNRREVAHLWATSC